MSEMKNITKVKIYYKDTDAEGVVYYANYLGFLEMGRMELIEQLGISQNDLKEKTGIVFAISEVNCKYLAPAFLGDKLVIETSIKEMTAATIVFLQEIIREKDLARVISATVTAFAMDLKKMKPAKIPIEFRERFEG
jgi:acyl-CoA thioester hydrolase